MGHLGVSSKSNDVSRSDWPHVQHISMIYSDVSLQMTDTHGVDVAGSLYTNTYRNTKIKGQPPAATNLKGTGSVSLCK